jgi:hypothetical protein
MQEATVSDVAQPTEIEMADLTESVGLEIDAGWALVSKEYVYKGS